MAETLDPCIDFLFADGRRARDAPEEARIPLPAAKVPAPLTPSVGRLYGFIWRRGAVVGIDEPIWDGTGEAVIPCHDEEEVGMDVDRVDTEGWRLR